MGKVIIINKVIIYILSGFIAAAMIDKLLFHGRFGYGPKFDEGIITMGPLALAMVGIMCFAPVLGNILTSVVTPVYQLLGADPAMFAGALLGSDMGGYPLAQTMTDDPAIVRLSGMYTGTMMGVTIVFSIPVALGIIDDRDKPCLAKGMLAGFIAVPFGVFVSALVDDIPAVKAIINIIPSVILSVLLALGLKFMPEKVLKGFQRFGEGITLFIVLCLAVASVEELTGITIIEGMAPIQPQFECVGIIAITLAGAYPLVYCITKNFSKPLVAAGRFIGVNGQTIAGMLACLANSIPMFSILHDMDEKGKIYAVAFSVCASFALGDHLGYATSQDQSLIVPMIVGKLAGGIMAIIMARLLIIKKS